jgi:transposase
VAKVSAEPKSSVVDDGWRIPEVLWTRFVELLPPRPVHKLGCHRPRVDDRKAMDAIFFVLRTGCQWNALNATGICSSSSAHRRFQEWVAAGVFHKIWQLGLVEYDGLKGLDWRWQSMDGAMTKAPLGGEKDGQEPHRPGQARGQAERADGGRRGAGRVGGGGGQPERFQDGAGDDREHPGRAA